MQTGVRGAGMHRPEPGIRLTLFLAAQPYRSGVLCGSCLLDRFATNRARFMLFGIMQNIRDRRGSLSTS